MIFFCYFLLLLLLLFCLSHMIFLIQVFTAVESVEVGRGGGGRGRGRAELPILVQSSNANHFTWKLYTMDTISELLWIRGRLKKPKELLVCKNLIAIGENKEKTKEIDMGQCKRRASRRGSEKQCVYLVKSDTTSTVMMISSEWVAEWNVDEGSTIWHLGRMVLYKTKEKDVSYNDISFGRGCSLFFISIICLKNLLCFVQRVDSASWGQGQREMVDGIFPIFH